MSDSGSKESAGSHLGCHPALDRRNRRDRYAVYQSDEESERAASERLTNTDAEGGRIILEIKSILIKDTTQEERERIIKESLDCGGGCENCSSCWIGGGSPWEIYQDYIDGKREIKEINAEYTERYRQGRKII